MKIAIFTPRYPGIGGIEKHIETLKDVLEKDGHSVSIITANCIYKLFHNHAMTQLIGSFVFQVISIFKTQDFDIINIQAGPGGLLLCPIRKNRNTKVFYTIHHTYHQQIVYLGEKLKYPLMIIEKVLCRVADKIITVSPSTKKILISKYHIKNEKIEILRNPSGPDIEPSIKKKKVKKTILFVGRFDKRKNPIFMIKLMYAIKKIDGSFFMFLVGDGKLKKRCEYLSRRLKISDHICFLGRLSEEEKIRIMSRCEYLIIPSLFEGQGIIYLEGNDMGMKVLCKNCDGLRDMCPTANRFETIGDVIRIITKGLTNKKNELEKYSYNNYVRTVKSIFKLGNRLSSQ